MNPQTLLKAIRLLEGLLVWTDEDTHFSEIVKEIEELKTVMNNYSKNPKIPETHQQLVRALNDANGVKGVGELLCEFRYLLIGLKMKSLQSLIRPQSRL